MTLADDIERYAEELPDDRAGFWFKENAARIAGELRTTPDVALIGLLYRAWGVIANAGQGDWRGETAEWQQAAERWRDDFHAALDKIEVVP